MAIKFENLRVWQKAMDFRETIFDIPKKFPNDEIYNLTSQIRRTVDSIALNIAEETIGQSNREQSKFIGYSMRSSAEVVTCLHKAKRRKYIEEDEFDTMYLLAEERMNRLSAFRKILK